MSALDNYYIGIDMGTSYTKSLVVNEDGEHLAIASFKSKWSGARAGEAEGVADEFVEAALSAIKESIALAEEKVGHAIQIAGIGITGLAESGVTVDPSGKPMVPVLAWYDERGEEEMHALPQKFQDDFVRKTGLIYTAQCSLGKVLFLHNNHS